MDIGSQKNTIPHRISFDASVGKDMRGLKCGYNSRPGDSTLCIVDFQQPLPDPGLPLPKGD